MENSVALVNLASLIYIRLFNNTKPGGKDVLNC